jgi:hypothetical protein
MKILVIDPDQQDNKQDHKDQELQKALPFFAVIHLIHSLAKKRQISRLSNPWDRMDLAGFG